LRARRGPIHLVGEHDVGEDRPRYEFERQVFLVEDARARDVGGQKVWGALDPAEDAAYRRREGSREHSLARARQVLEKDVSACHETGQGQADHAVLADDDEVDVLLHPVEQLGGTTWLEGWFLCRGHNDRQSRGATRRQIPSYSLRFRRSYGV